MVILTEREESVGILIIAAANLKEELKRELPEMIATQGFEDAMSLGFSYNNTQVMITLVYSTGEHFYVNIHTPICEKAGKQEKETARQNEVEIISALSRIFGCKPICSYKKKGKSGREFEWGNESAREYRSAELKFSPDIIDFVYYQPFEIDIRW